MTKHKLAAASAISAVMALSAVYVLAQYVASTICQAHGWLGGGIGIDGVWCTVQLLLGRV